MLEIIVFGTLVTCLFYLVFLPSFAEPRPKEIKMILMILLGQSLILLLYLFVTDETSEFWILLAGIFALFSLFTFLVLLVIFVGSPVWLKGRDNVLASIGLAGSYLFGAYLELVIWAWFFELPI